MLGLFDGGGGTGSLVPEPLAARMRPRNLDEFVGQDQIVGPGRALRRAIESDVVPSLILWGPPGTGKTTLAQIIAGQTGAHFTAISAVSAGVADLRRVVADARKLKAAGRRSVLFIDEIHRFNKAQQDAVLPYVEDGTVTLIGATTENPSFEVNSALLSRSRVFVLTALRDPDVRMLLERALSDEERGLGRSGVRIEPDALDALVNLANGDARVALGTLEFAAAAALPDAAGRPAIDTKTVADALQKRARTYDKGGDAHYDTISAFIKTVRGSDPDAAVYYLARMIESGEDALFIARRLVILASEDIGLADRHALPLAMAAQQAVHFIGMPEGFYPLAHATIYLATAPKSNTVGRAYSAALADVAHSRNDPVPGHLRNAPTSLLRQLGYGDGYKYAHTEYAAMDAAGDGPPPVVLQSNLPEALAGRQYVEPTRQGDEARLRAWFDERRGAVGARPGAADADWPGGSDDPLGDPLG
jgi:putative ATPase